MKPGNGCLKTHFHKGTKYYERITCEQELCHDCNATAGQPHHPGCDMERCPICNGQFISCEHLKTATLSIKPIYDPFKAPWRYERRMGYGITIIGKGGTWIAETQDTALARVDPTKALFRASLIASAPDLLEFVKELSNLEMFDYFAHPELALRKKAQKLLKRIYSNYYVRKS